MLSNTVSRKSPLYWAHEQWDSDIAYNLVMGKPVSLCKYFWQGVFFLLVISFLTAATTLIVVAVCYVVISLLLFLSTALTGHVFEFINVDLIYSTLTVLALAALIGTANRIYLTVEGELPILPNYVTALISIVYKKLGIPEPTPKEETIKVETPPNILVQYYKAHKAKWCPNLVLEKL